MRPLLRCNPLRDGAFHIGAAFHPVAFFSRLPAYWTPTPRKTPNPFGTAEAGQISALRLAEFLLLIFGMSCSTMGTRLPSLKTPE